MRTDSQQLTAAECIHADLSRKQFYCACAESSSGSVLIPFWRLEPEEQMAEGEKLVAEFPSVRHKKQDGVLLLTSARVAWSAGEFFQVNYPYHQIKG